MTNAEKPDQSPRTDRLRSAAAVVGMLLIGPVFAGFVISRFIAGELPGHHTLTVAEHPILFYLIISALAYGAFKMMQLSLLFVVGYFGGRWKR